MRGRSVKCVVWLKNLGVGCNDIVTVCTSNHLDTYIPYLATLYIDAILSVWHEMNRHLKHFLQSRPKVIFVDVDKALLISYVARMMNIPTVIIVFKKEDKKTDKVKNKFLSVKTIINNYFNETDINEFSCTKLKSNNTAVILFSSGTTGATPKHVAIPHTFFTAPSIQQIPIMLSDGVGLWIESLHWNISLLLTVRAILSYVKVVKMNQFSNPSFEQCICDTIQKYKVTWVFLKIDVLLNNSFHYEIFKKYDVFSLKQMIFGCRITVNLLYENFVAALPNVSVIPVHCLPETGMIIHQRHTGKLKSSYVNKNIHLMCADFNTESPLKVNNYGVIWCKSPSLTNGYFSIYRPESKIPVIDDNGWFHTNEVGYYQANDNIQIQNSSRHIIRYKNSRFSPLEIEKVLLDHPEVKGVAVIPVINARDGHHPMALIIPKEGSKVSKQEFIQFVAKNMDDCMQLHAGVQKSLKFSSNGCLDRDFCIL